MPVRPARLLPCERRDSLRLGEMRDDIFRRELPLVLEALRCGDDTLYFVYPHLDDAPVQVHFRRIRAASTASRRGAHRPTTGIGVIVRVLKWILIALVVFLVVAVMGFAVWAYTPSGPGEEALAALQSDAAVTVTTGPWLTFTQPAPRRPPASSSIRVAGWTRVLRAGGARHRRAGYLVVITPMPFNLAVFAADRAKRVVEAHPEIAHWAVGGIRWAARWRPAIYTTQGAMRTGWCCGPATRQQ